MNESQEILNEQVGNTLQKVSNQLIETQQVNGTPFEIVTTERGSFIALGKLKLTKDVENKEELKEMIYNMDYDFLINLVIGLIGITKDIYKAAEVELTEGQ